MLLGVDGGGTKTDVAVADAAGRTVATVRVGCTNHETVGMERAMQTLGDGVRRALADADTAPAHVTAAVFGLAGVDWPSDEAAIGRAVAAFGIGGARVVANDSRIALAAGATDGWGIVSAIGTGAVTAGVDRSGRWVRTMSVGWGEPCGATSLVADALHAIAAHHHRTGAATGLTDRFLGALSVADVDTLFEAISRNRIIVDARHAPLVQLAADAGDRVAADVLERSGSAHAAMVVGTAERLGLRDEPFDLVTAGGVHAAGGRFVAAFRARVDEHCPRARLVPLERPAVDGALALARSLVAPPARSTGRSTG